MRPLAAATKKGGVYPSKDLLSPSAALSTLPGSEQVNGPVFDLYRDSGQNLWIGSKDRGLLILTDGRLIPAGDISGLLLSPVFRI